MRRLFVCLFAAALAPFGAADAGPLLDKALAYSDRMQETNLPGYGCRVEVLWTDETLTEVEKYDDLGDSGGWTGNYIGAEAFRYAVTGDPEAKAYAKRALDCALLLPYVTDKPGYIARFIGPHEGPYATYVGACAPGGSCHLIDSGPYAGHFWLGDTSSDTYIEWWWGLSLAWDYLLDAPEDEPYRLRIQQAVRDVLDQVIDDGYRIVNPDGTPSRAAPDLIGNERIAFHLVAANILGGAYRDMLPQVYADNLLPYVFSTLAPITRWYQYYAFHLGFQLQHLIVRNETFFPFLGLHRQLFWRNLHLQTKGTGQAAFDYMVWGEGADKPKPAEEALAKDVLDRFPSPPKLKVQPDQTPWTPDPVIDAFNTLGPILAPLFGAEWDPLGPQALEPFPGDRRCVVGHYWNRSPYHLCGPGDHDPRFEYAGHDYLEAYWMGRFYGFLAESD
ncbi:MAG: hypothetical protein K8I02_00075 [Candidatus Methylomirabilis sp.]|nr:hypothetical protein [Deltaproteobacteria bacterium]